MTEEEMRAEIVRLTEHVSSLETENSTISSELSTSKTRIADLQEHNQKLFLKITHKPEDTQETEIPPVEDFAKTLTF